MSHLFRRGIIFIRHDSLLIFTLLNLNVHIFTISIYWSECHDCTCCCCNLLTLNFWMFLYFVAFFLPILKFDSCLLHFRYHELVKSKLIYNESTTIKLKREKHQRNQRKKKKLFSIHNNAMKRNKSKSVKRRQWTTRKKIYRRKSKVYFIKQRKKYQTFYIGLNRRVRCWKWNSHFVWFICINVKPKHWHPTGRQHFDRWPKELSCSQVEIV